MKSKRFFLKINFFAQKNLQKLKNTNLRDLTRVYLLATRKLPDIVHLKNLVLFCLVFSIVAFFMFVASFRELNAYYYVDSPKSGGIYSEGSLGKFFRINPIYSKTNTNDEDAVNLVFSGLMKRNDDGELMEDLAEEYNISKDRRVYSFKIKEGVKWHDGQDFSVEDIIFTINLIQNPDVRSPLYEVWKNVKVEAIDDRSVKFVLADPLNSFLDNVTIGIVPKHILGDIPPSSVQTIEFNTDPIGTGPYKFEMLEKEIEKETLFLEINENYYGEPPLVGGVELYNYLSEEDIVDAYRRKIINSIGNPTFSLVRKLENLKGTDLHKYILPRYIAVFFNMENELLQDKDIRKALTLSVDRDELLKEIDQKGSKSYYPIPANMIGYSKDLPKNEQNLEKAKKIIGKKDITLRIVTGDSEDLKKTAEKVSANFNAIGVKTEIININMSSLQNDYIRPRNYDVLIVGENLGSYPDLFSMWHSTQVNDPGLNFSKYSGREIDKLLEQSRKAVTDKKKQEKLEEIQKIILNEYLAVYLYNPYYFQITSDMVKGIEEGKIIFPSDRFYNISDWYIKADKVMIDK